MPMVRAHVGARGRSANLATWRFNWGSPTVSDRFVIHSPASVQTPENRPFPVSNRRLTFYNTNNSVVLQVSEVG